MPSKSDIAREYSKNIPKPISKKEKEVEEIQQDIMD